MSYFLADSTGYLADFASIGGLSAFNEWAVKQELPFPHLVRDGFVKDFEDLRSVARMAHVPPTVKEQVDLLVEHSRTAKDILIISDGVDDSAEMRAAAAEPPMLRVADAALKSLEATIAIALASAARAYVTRGEQGALDALEKSLSRHLPTVLEKTFLRGKAATILSPVLRTNAALKMTFGVPNQKAKVWAKKHSAELVQGISDTTRDIIRTAVSDKGMKSSREIAALINDDVRGELIARTESIRAANEGQLDAWFEAKEKGWLDKSAKRVWIATGDDLLCPTCEPMDGVEVALDDPFVLDSGEAILAPPAHPRCRCTVGLA